MTRAEILALAAGRECDAAVAVALGWKMDRIGRWMPPGVMGLGTCCDGDDLPRYSTDAAAALAAVDAVVKGNRLNLNMQVGDGFAIANFYICSGEGVGKQVSLARADTLPLAISRALLLAKAGE